MNRPVHLLAKAALVALAAFSVVQAALPVLRHAAGIVVTEGGAPPAPPHSTPRARTDLSPLLARAPFGREPSDPPATTQTSARLPAFVLRGVFASDGASSAALLEVDGATDRYRPGDKVTETFDLSEVAPDHVTLTGAGQTITLSFEDAHLSASGSQADQIASDPAALIARLGRDLVVPIRAEKPKAPETTSEYIDYWRKRIRKNPQAVLDEIGLTPSPEGYVIADRHDVGVKLAGLKAGDLVRSVNGQSVGDPDDDRRFYDRIAASGQARLEVERNGRVLTFSFPLR